MTARNAGMVTVADARGRASLGNGIDDFALDGEDIQLSPELEEQMAEMFKAEEMFTAKAKYKLEVLFTDERSAHRPYRGLITLWSNGGYNHGDGDEGIYLCPTKLETGRFCNTPLKLEFVSKRVAVCPSCSSAHDPKNLTGQIYAKITTQHWANLILKVFNVLGGNADILIGMYRGQLRTPAIEAVTSLGAREKDKVNAIRRDRHWVAYSLKSIIQDTANGSNLHERVRCLLEA